MALIEIHIHSDDAKLEKILQLVTNIGETMATQADIDLLTAQAVKIQEEVDALKASNAAAAEALRAEILRLEDIIANGTDLDLTALKTALQILDDNNPDATPPEA